MDYDVIILRTRDNALQLNEGLNDDEKVAFQDDKGTSFYTYTDTDVSGLDSNDYSLGQITTEVVAGSGIVSKTRRMFPKP